MLIMGGLMPEQYMQGMPNPSTKCNTLVLDMISPFSASLLESFQQFFQDYKESTQKTQSRAHMSESNCFLEQELKDVKVILHTQQQQAKRQTEGLLNTSSNEDPEEKKPEGVDMWSAFTGEITYGKHEVNKRGADTWTLATNSIQRGIGRLLRHIPEEKEEDTAVWSRR